MSLPLTYVCWIFYISKNLSELANQILESKGRSHRTNDDITIVAILIGSW